MNNGPILIDTHTELLFEYVSYTPRVIIYYVTVQSEIKYAEILATLINHLDTTLRLTTP